MVGLSAGGRLRALLWLRFTQWRHGLRRKASVLDTAVGIALTLLVTAAIYALIEGKPVASVQKPSIGCNIKWKRGKEPDYA